MSNSQAEAGPVQTRPDLFQEVCSAMTIFDTIGDGFLVTGSGEGVLACNYSARSLLGHDLAEMTPDVWRGRYDYGLRDASKPENLGQVPLIRALEGHELTRQEMHLGGPNVRDVWLSVTARPIYTGDGRFEWTYIILRDINLRKWAEQKMRLHSRAMDSAREGIIIADMQAEGSPIIYVNEGYERLTGFRRDEVLNQPYTMLYGRNWGTEDVRQAEESLGTVRPVALELPNQRRDGSEFWTRLSITPIRGRDGRPTHYIAVLSDITGLIQTEQRLQETTEQLEEANQKITWVNERMKQDLEAAAKVQRAMLPSSLPELDHLRFTWAFEPNEELSGDILNVIPLDDDHLGLYILDVTGHGVASSMLSVTVSRLLVPVRSATSLVYERVRGPEGPSYRVAPPGKVATRLAMRFRWNLEAGQFFTLVYGVLNVHTLEFRYACAGHPPPLYVDAHSARYLERTGDQPIGIGRGSFAECSVQLKPGSRMYLYSDGIVEAMGPDGKLYGEDRILATLRDRYSLPLRESVSSLLKNVEEWRQGMPARDDISLLAVEAVQK